MNFHDLRDNGANSPFIPANSQLPAAGLATEANQ